MDSDLGLLVLRVVIGGVVMQHGLLKLGWVGKGGSVTGVAGWFNGMGMRPGLWWALVAIAAEAGGGLLTVLGLGGPLGPGILAGDLVVVTIVAHVPQGFWAGGGKVGWEFPLPLAAASFTIALLGNGSWSLDGLLGLTYSEQTRWLWLAIVAVGTIAALGSKLAFAPKQAST
jgi:putative oxidoreductase